MPSGRRPVEQPRQNFVVYILIENWQITIEPNEPPSGNDRVIRTRANPERPTVTWRPESQFAFFVFEHLDTQPGKPCRFTLIEPHAELADHVAQLFHLLPFGKRDAFAFEFVCRYQRVLNHRLDDSILTLRS